MAVYNISKTADNRLFKEVCAVIEKTIPIIEKEPLLMDVDGTLIQIYAVMDGKIKVINDYEVDAVYVEEDGQILCPFQQFFPYDLDLIQ